MTVWLGENVRSASVIFLGLVTLFWVLISPLAAQAPEGWLELKGQHFIIYYQGSRREFSDLVLKQAEFYYDRVAHALGYSRRSDFWLWENRCLIYLYGTQDAFHAETKQATWSSGYAIPKKRTIVSYEGASQFLDSVLPHELAHLILRDFIGLQNGKVPLWLDEGLAMAQEEAKREYFDRLVSEMILQEKWIPIGIMSRIRSVKDLDQDQSAIFYAQAQSLVRFLLDFREPGRFVQLCRDVRDGHTLEKALAKNYPKDFPTLEAFENRWVKSHV